MGLQHFVYTGWADILDLRSSGAGEQLLQQSTAQAGQWNIQIEVNPTLVREEMGHPVSNIRNSTTILSLSLSHLNEELLDEDEVGVGVKVLVEAEERPRRLQAVASHLQLALRVHVLHQEL